MNRLLQENVHISSLRRKSSEKASFQIAYKDIALLKRFRKSYQCKIRFNRKSGFPRIINNEKVDSGDDRYADRCSHYILFIKFDLECDDKRRDR